MPEVNMTAVDAYFSTTAPGNVIDANPIDPAIQALITSINDNWTEFLNLKNALELPIPDQSIVTRHLRNLAVTNPKLAPLAVTADKIADGTITTAKLADLVITAAKIADGTITESKYATGSVSKRAIAPNSVDASKMDPSLYANITDIAMNTRFGNIESKLPTRKNALKYGVVGDGVTDDYAALQAFFDQGGYIKIPSGRYYCSRGLKINNFVDIEGDRYNDASGNAGTVLIFDIPDSDISAINFSENASLSSMKNVFVLNQSANKTVYGVSSICGALQWFRRFTFEEVYTSGFNYGFYLPTCYLGKISKCYAQYNNTGFHFQGFSTSLNIDSCYALDNTEINYFINNLSYSTFTGCASDGSKYGYWLKSNRGVTFDACGAENIGICVFYVDNDNKNIVVNALTGYGTSTIASPPTNLGSMIHVNGSGIAEIVINGVYELTKNNIGTRPSSITIGSTIRSTLNNYTVEGQVNVGHCCLRNGRYMNNAVPTSGYHETGEIVWNSNPTNGIAGWACYVGGTPGTWLIIPGTTTVDNSISPLFLGQMSILANQIFVAMGSSSSADWAKVGKAVAVPATATSSGRAGDYACDANYFYTCYATNSWRRVAISPW